MEHNLQDQQAMRLSGRVNWPCLFEIIIWRLWKNRNLRIFQGLSWSTNEVINVSLCWAKQYVSTFRTKGTKPSWTDLIPDSLDSWVYLNTDGSVKYEGIFAATGGILRDQKGIGIVGYTRYLGFVKLLIRNYGAFSMGCKLPLIVVFRKFLSGQIILKRLTSFMREFGKALILP
ncbi:hypothetical protein J1N35_007068 [Gossypium stocksii]|uniref:RNase H type-1 domain-containing protein n=1 Tax=Gossypium stocksii TaxID=47602 RepID=A0A9D3W7L5_9ROSI|nr:hypothetical protein J1N35_007068 [Gossypium stocksii]